MSRQNVLVVLGHPDLKSYCAALADTYAAGLDTDRYDVEVLRLGELDFDPVLRFGYRERMPADPVVDRSKELVLWADHIVLVFPVWWSQMPSLLKGWLDRVLTAGFAYAMPTKARLRQLGLRGLVKQGSRPFKLLHGRTATLVVTSQGPAWMASAPMVRLTRRHVLGLCGISTTQVLTHGWLTTARDTQARRERFLAKVDRAATRLDVRRARRPAPDPA